MNKFLRSINQKIQKSRIVVENGQEKKYNSLIEMSTGDRMTYIINAMNSCDEEYMTAEQFAVARQSVKDMMIQALSKGCR